MRTAQKCGIYIPEIRLINDRYFSIKRFDIYEGHRIHTLTAAALLQSDFRAQNIDYVNLLALTGYLTQDPEQVEQMFRRMVFNIVCANKDDHAKNFAFVHCGSDWRFAPAYDLLPSDGINGFRTTSINDSIEPTKEDIIAVAVKAGLNRKDVIAEFDKMEQYIAEYKSTR